jgi:hypothetical protein
VITADGCGRNGPQSRITLWKRELQRFANETGMKITVTHLAPGSSKWKSAPPFHLHHAELARQAAGQPPGDRATHWHSDNGHGPQIYCELRANLYPNGIKIAE